MNLINNPKIRNPLISLIPFTVCVIGTIIGLYIFNLQPTLWWIPLFPIIFGGILSLFALYNDFKEWKNFTKEKI